MIAVKWPSSRADRYPLLGQTAPSDRPVHAFARQRDADGATGKLRRSRAQDLMLPQRLGTEAAADIG
jgi:hypothetical protein